jgi:hypothetical protein
VGTCDAQLACVDFYVFGSDDVSQYGGTFKATSGKPVAQTTFIADIDVASEGFHIWASPCSDNPDFADFYLAPWFAVDRRAVSYRFTRIGE